MQKLDCIMMRSAAHTVHVGRDLKENWPSGSDAMKQFAKRSVLLFLLLSLIFTVSVSAADTNAAEGILPEDYAPKVLVPGGECLGIQLFSEGVIVLSFRDLDSGGSKICPAKSAGLRTGDVILAVDGKCVNSVGEFTDAIDGGGETVELSVRRGETVKNFTVSPYRDGDTAMIGAVVRDSTAGLGTVTFYDPETGLIGCLGHPICDRDTGEIFTISGGSLISARVAGVEKGRVGDPGELIGSDFGTLSLASLYENCEAGIFGVVDDPSVFGGETAITVAGEDDVAEGEAEILSCINGNSVQRYSVEIVNVRDLDDGDLRDLEIRITDPGLLSVTGGIVQGMSGSPIIQNGKLIGAVTHVLVNDPTRGYGIFIENMLDAAG